MNLFLNTISEKAKLILFDDKKEIKSEFDFQILGNESEKLIWIIDDFLKRNNIDYKDLENLVVVAGPWSFTWIRTIVLLVNTINFVIKKNITTLNYFDLFDSYPIVKSSSKRDSFFKKDKNSEVEIIKNENILEYLSKNNITKIYWENKNLTPPLAPPLQEGNNKKSPLLGGDLEGGILEIFENIDYSAIIKKIKFDNKKIAQAIYIKKPSIS